MRTLLLSLALLTVTPVALAQTDEPSAADIESARASFQEGLELRDKNRDMPGAIAKLKAAYALVQTPRIAFELGKTQRMSGDLLSARQTFLEVDRIPARTRESEEAKRARSDSKAQAVELESKIPTLALNIISDGSSFDDTVITIDDKEVSHDSLAAPRKLNPGRHVVALQMPNRPVAKRNVELREGEAKSIEIKLPKRNAPPSTDPNDVGFKTSDGEKVTTRNNPLHQTLLWSTIGLVTLGSITGIYAIATASDAAKKCTSNICGNDAVAGRNTAMTLAWVANISFGAALATGILYFVIPPLEVSRGTTVGVAPAPGGGFLSFQGKF